jgi:hypothetical protein
MPSKEESDKVTEKARKSGADPGVVLFVFGPRSEDFTPYIAVMIPPAPRSFDSSIENQTLKEIKDGFVARGAPAPEIKTAHPHINGHAAFSIAYETEGPATKKVLRFWTVWFPSKKGCCIVRCTALKSQWSEVVPDFKSVVNSVKFDEAPAK